MKIYAVVGTSQQTLVADKAIYNPQDNEILMQSERTSDKHIAGLDGVWYLQEQSLDELKTAKIQEAGAEFAKRRDVIRWVGQYGYDCKNEDTTNFYGCYFPLLYAGSGSATYKVWITETTKGMVELTLEQLNLVYNTVRESQLEAYAWYEAIKAQILACETVEDLKQITW